MNLLGLDMPLANTSDTLNTWFEKPDARPELNDDVPGRYKGSIRFMELIREWLSGMEADSVPDTDFSPWDGKVLSKTEIENWFGEEYKHYPLAKRKERVMARVHRWIEMELKKPMPEAVRKERKKKQRLVRRPMPKNGLNMSRLRYINSCSKLQRVVLCQLRSAGLSPKA